MSVLYAVKGYPTKVIINPDGVIEGVYEGEVPEFYKKIDELLN